MQVSKSIQNQSVPLTFLPGPGSMQATGQAPTQSAIPSQIFVTIVCAIVFSQKNLDRELAISNWQHLLSIGRIHNIINSQLPTTNSQFPITLIYRFNCWESFGIYPSDLSNSSIARIFPRRLSSLAILQIYFYPN